MADKTTERINVTIDGRAVDCAERVHVRFGPHYGVEVWRDGDETKFCVVATHHGFQANASEVAGELEKIVYEVRSSHPELATD